MSEIPQLPGAKTATAAVDNAQFTTSGSLVDLVDSTEKVLVVLRDQRNLIGVLRSYDQYANFVLSGAVERFYARKSWAELDRGIYLIRGENVLLIGEVDLDLEDIPIPGWQQVSPEEAIKLAKEDQDAAKVRGKDKAVFLKQNHGFSEEMAETG